MKFIRLTSSKDISRSFVVIKDLIPTLAKDVYLKSVLELIEDGYIFFAIKHDNQIVSVARARISKNLSLEKYMWLYTFVTKEEYRGKGYGKQLLGELEKYALKHQCISIRLHTGITRNGAHGFYKSQGYENKYYVFCKELAIHKG